jgi:uncharacterized protein (DUF1330 family)
MATKLIQKIGPENMSAFVVVDTRIKDPVAYEEYKSMAKPIAEKYGGVYRVRGGEMDIRETDLWSPTRIVIVEFPDMQSARAFVDSEEYAPVKPKRINNADCTLFIVDGG